MHGAAERADFLTERIDEVADPRPERHERARRRATATRFARSKHSHDEASMFPFELDELREGRLDRELVGIARVDAAEERLGEPFEGFSSEATTNERRDRFVGLRRARQNEIEPHASHPGDRKETAPNERHDLRRHSEDEAFGQRDELAAPQDEHASILRCRFDQAIAEPELARELDRLGLLAHESVWAAIEDETVASNRSDFSSETRL